jgi:hypothetical protein
MRYDWMVAIHVSWKPNPMTDVSLASLNRADAASAARQRH